MTQRRNTLTQVSDSDDTLFHHQRPKPHRFVVALGAESTPILAGLLQEGNLTAAELIHAALLAVWLAKSKGVIPQPARYNQQMSYEFPTHISDILKGKKRDP